MGKVDAQTKLYMSDNRRFADLYNYRVYGGEQVIKPELLQEMDVTELLVIQGKGKKLEAEKIRDVLKKAVIKADEDACYVLLGIENQTTEHLAMPVRNMTYDAMRYCKQVTEIAKKNNRRVRQRSKKKNKKQKVSSAEFLSGLRIGDKLLPVVTLTLYWSVDAWNGPKRLHEMLEIKDERLRKYIQDYDINLIQPVEIEEFSFFESDLGEVLEAIKVSNSKEALTELVQKKEEFQHMERDAAMVINSVAGMELELGEEEEKVNVCKAVLELREEGRESLLREKVKKKLLKGKSIEVIAEELEETPEKIQEICNTMKE